MGRAALIALCGLVWAGCAENECSFHSACGASHYCRAGRCLQDCRLDTDCATGLVCSAIGQCGAPPEGGLDRDGGAPDGTPDAAPPDATSPDATGPDASDPDGGIVVIDAAPPDARPPDAAGPPDGGPTGTAAYLDRCTNAAECASGLCAPDVGGSYFCTRTCATHGECADEHVCVGGVCVRDDTGGGCNVASPETCATGLCLGGAGGLGACTRQCASARECPAGYACTLTGGAAFRICVDIERPCASAADCATGLCIPGRGCTAGCRSWADCPARIGALPPYTCATDLGAAEPICVPPADILGSDPIGAPCFSWETCRSGICDPDAPPAPMCTQQCGAEGGCGPGLGCYPVIDPVLGLLDVCRRAGNLPLGAFCSQASDCESALCDAPTSRCTRRCADGLCPSGWICAPVPGYAVQICRP